MARTDETKDGFWRRRDDTGSKTRRFWYATVGGKRVSTGCRDIAAARLWRAEREREQADPAYAAANTVTIGLANSRFLMELKAAGVADETIRFYRQKLAAFVTFYGEEAKLSKITPSSVQDFVIWRSTESTRDDGLIETAVSQATVRKEIDTLLTMLRSAHHRGEINYEPNSLKPLRLGKKYTPRTRHPTRPEFTRIVLELERRNMKHRAAWLCAAVATGGRLAEVNRLRRAAINMDSAQYSIDVTKTKKTEGKLRVRPILAKNIALLQYALDHGKGEAPLLLAQWGASNMVQTLQRVCAHLGIQAYSANDFRRALASWLHQDGVPPSLIAYILGHSTSHTTERTYAQMTPEAARRLIENCTDSGPDSPIPGLSAPELSAVSHEKTGTFLDGQHQKDMHNSDFDSAYPSSNLGVGTDESEGTRSGVVPKLNHDAVSSAFFDGNTAAALITRSAVDDAKEGDRYRTLTKLAAAAEQHTGETIDTAALARVLGGAS